MNDIQTRPRWSAAATVSFRWFAIFSLLFLVPLAPLTNLAIPWLGEVVLGLEGKISTAAGGSTDTTAEYIRLALHAILALIGVALWTARAGARGRHPKLVDWLTFSLRLSIATMMFSYGLAKITGGQFSDPDDMRLLQNYGDSSPMGLLWTFMGHSKVYSGFTGIAEICGGALLLSRRTTTLGAIVVVGVMSNVVMLNLCYDVPVKLFSMRILVWASFLVALDGKRLYAVFTNSGTVPPRTMGPLFSKPRRHLIGQVFKALYGFSVILTIVFAPSFMGSRDEGSTTALQGTYEVTVFSRDGQQVPALVSDDERWHRVVWARWDRVFVYSASGKRIFYAPKLEGNTLTLTRMRDDEKVVTEFTVSSDDDGLKLHSDDFQVEMEPYAPEFLLRDRGFHWVQEFPYNR
ncbi:MAG: hypothetical protein KUG77_10585 [Nannocystaceae bacterium]|nr:hypothetical protein [Nannocystaceae bacterium]